MTTSAPNPVATFAPLRWGVHAIVAVAVGLVSPFTGLAWPFALMVGMVLGSSSARRERGHRDGLAETASEVLVVAIGALGMLFFGAIIGGLIAIPVAMLASFSERAAAHASPTDRGVARILLFVVPITMWLVVFPLLGMNVDIRIGN